MIALVFLPRNALSPLKPPVPATKRLNPSRSNTNGSSRGPAKMVMPLLSGPLMVASGGEPVLEPWVTVPSTTMPRGKVALNVCFPFRKGVKTKSILASGIPLTMEFALLLK